MYRNYLLIVLCVFALGCVTTETQSVKVIDTPIVHPPLPQKLSLKPVVWEIINIETNSYFALTSEGYGNLSQNVSDITGYIEKLRVIIQYYHNIRPTTNNLSTNTPPANTSPAVTNTNKVPFGVRIRNFFGGEPTSAPIK